VRKVKSETEHQADEWVDNKKKYEQNYNETAVAIIAIVPDDDPMWPKHVELYLKLH
jgi:hypothetical protein